MQQDSEVLSCGVVSLVFSPLKFKSELKSWLTSFMCVFLCVSVGIVFLNFH